MERHFCRYKGIGYDGSSCVFIGTNDKAKRVCRFCDKSIPDVKFKNKAHALSESIGNKSIFNNEECDDCNNSFGVGIEQDFYNCFAFLLELNNVKGKRSSRKVKGDKAIIYNDDNVFVIQPLPDQIPFIDKNEINYPSHKFKPINVYKCLVKYALSVIDAEYLHHFKETIMWVKGKNVTFNNLPNVIVYTIEPIQHPRIAVFVRQSQLVDFPFVFARLEFACLGYCFILPIKNEESSFNTQFSKLMYLFNDTQISEQYLSISLSRTETCQIIVNLDLSNIRVGYNAIETNYPIAQSIKDILK